MQKPLLTLSILLATTASYATDAGTTLRHATPPPATIAPLTTEQGNISTDTTPISVSDVVLVGNTLLSAHQFETYLASIRGTSTTFGGLQSLARTISNEYRKAGYPLATVIIPPQRLENGVVRLQVIEGSIGDVVVNNESRVSDKAVKDYLNKSIKTGQPLNQADSERALLLIKDLAGTDNVNYRLQGGQNSTNLVVELDKSRLMDGFVQVDNYGSKSTGVARVRVGANAHSVFGQGEKISAQAMTSFQGVNYARLSADMPVGGDGLAVSAGVGHTRYALGGAFKDLNATGQATSVDVGVRYPKVRSHAQSLWLNASAEHRALLDTIKTSQTETKKSLNAVHFGASAFAQYAHANAQYSAEAAVGHLHHVHDTDRAYDKAAANTQGVYAKISASGSYTHHIGASSLGVSVRGQWASKNLDSAEQLSLGGADGVAAYSANAVSADQAVIAQLQARHRIGAFSVGGFYDIASAKLRAKPYLQDANTTTLKGYGVLAQGNYQGVNIQGKLAWQVGKVRPQTWISVGYNF